MKFYLCLSVVFLVSACGVTPQDKTEHELTQKAKLDQQTGQKPDQLSTSDNVLTGTLTNEGVMCQAMRGDDGTLYVFENLPEALQNGDEIRVERDSPADPLPSYCDQGEVVMWTVITKLEDGKPSQVWRKDT